MQGSNYRSQMDDIVERINRKPRIIQCIQAYNEEDFIQYVLSSIYDEVDRIIVVEGAVQNRIRSDSPRSTDKTIELIKQFIEEQDPDEKITFIQRQKPYESLETMKQTFLSLVSQGDWLLINDADEFYKPEDIRRLRRAIDLKPTASEFIPLFLHFYRDWRHIRAPRYDWQPQHQRFFKYQRGMKYVSHPVVTDAQGQDTCLSMQYQLRRFILRDWFVWHYGYARPNIDELMKAKKEYYTKELAKLGANKEFDEKVSEFIDHTEPHDQILSYPLDLHPDILHSHPRFEYFDDTYKNDLFKSWEEASPYKEMLNRKPFGNIWLWMTGLNPRMPMFHNEISVLDRDINIETKVEDSLDD